MMTPFHIAAASGNLAIVENCLQKDLDINVRSEPNGFTPLHMCVSAAGEDRERQQVIEKICSCGADLEARTYDKGLTPLQMAAIHNKPLCIESLIRKGADIHALEGDGATALHNSAYSGFFDVCRLLIKSGANPNIGDNKGNTPVTLAMDEGHKEILQMLLDAGGTR
jgi:ankyrin repeat protein